MNVKGKKSKKNKQKNEEKPSQNRNIEKPKPKKRKPKDDTNAVAEKKVVKFTEETIDNEVEGNPSPKKKRKSQPISEEELAPLGEELEAEINKPENIKDVSSKRQQKRLKYEKLKADTKMKTETLVQQKALNYLSKWKHSRQEWKFEKIRQIWVQTHMFDSARVPDEFWDTTIQYFGGSKGQIRKVLIDKCMEIVDKADKSDDEEKETSEVDATKFKRARELLQHLQE